MNGGERRWEDQTKEQRDLYTQFVISLALGLGAFLSFCVRLQRMGVHSILIANCPADPSTEVDGAIRCAKATAVCRITITRTAG